MRFKKTVLATVAIALTGMAGLANAETWRFGLEEIKGSVQYQYAEQFKKLIEKKSDGDIKVQLLPYGKWGSTYSALYDAIQNNAIQIGFASGALGGTVPESQLLSLNFIMPEDQLETAKVLNSDAFLKSKPWQKSFRQRGLVPIAELPEGYQVWTANKPIHTPADMKNLHIRVMDNSLLRQTYKAYGASPVTIAYGELYSALQQGQADGNIQPVFAHEEMGFYEVQKDMIIAKQAQFVATVMGNKEWYEGLSDKDRQIVDQTTSELVSKGDEIQQKYNADRMKKIKSNSKINIITLNDEQRAKFREAAKPVRAAFAKDVGQRGEDALNILLKQFKQSDSGSSSAQ